MEGFIKNQTLLSQHKTNIDNYDNLVSGGAFSGSGVDWSKVGPQGIFSLVHSTYAEGLITRLHSSTDLDTLHSSVPEGVSIATEELMNDYLTSSKTVNAPSGNVEEEFGFANRIYSQDTVLGQLEEAVISFFEAVNFTPEIPVGATVINQSEELFLRSWMSRVTTNTEVKKFSIEKDKIRNLLFSGTSADRAGYMQVAPGAAADGTSTAEDLIRCVFDQDQMKTLAQQIQQAGRFTPLTGTVSSKVYTSEKNDGTDEVSVAGGQILQPDYLANCQSITPRFRHGQGVAVIVNVKASVPNKPTQTGYFLVRVFQSLWKQGQYQTVPAALTAGIDSNAPNALP